MKKTALRTIQLLLVASLPLVPSGNVPAEPKPLPWLLAQNASCDSDGRKLPDGSRVCNRQSVWVCSNGTWQNTREPC